VGGLGPAKAAGQRIITWARENQRVVVTLDADFHAELAVSGASTPSVIRLRMQGLIGPAVAQLIQVALSEFSEELVRGCMISVKPRKTTLHRLPVGRAG
jgi:predicted nuclease of predicted toxin-antitoxin system